MIKCPRCGSTAQVKLTAPLARVRYGVMEQWTCGCGCLITKFYTATDVYGQNEQKKIIYHKRLDAGEEE